MTHSPGQREPAPALRGERPTGPHADNGQGRERSRNVTPAPQLLQGPDYLVWPLWRLMSICHLKGTTLLLKYCSERAEILATERRDAAVTSDLWSLLQLPGSQLGQPKVGQKPPSCRNISSDQLRNKLTAPQGRTAYARKNNPQPDPPTTHV